MIITKRALRSLISDIVLRESKYFGMSISDVLSFLEGFRDNTWIFFDTETLGFNPKYQQLTEIGAVAVSPGNWNTDPKILGTFNEKVKLEPKSIERLSKHKEMSPEEIKARRGRMTAPEILSMTRYGERGREYFEEQDVIDGFLDFVDSFSNPVLVAQNASFDMKFVAVRSDRQPDRYPVIDTMRIMQLFLIPLLRTLSDQHDDQDAREFLEKIKKGKYYSASMGVVSSAYGISIDEWHNALADVKMLMKLLSHVVRTLRENPDIDIRDEHARAASRQKRRR